MPEVPRPFEAILGRLPQFNPRLVGAMLLSTLSVAGFSAAPAEAVSQPLGNEAVLSYSPAPEFIAESPDDLAEIAEKHHKPDNHHKKHHRPEHYKPKRPPLRKLRPLTAIPSDVEADIQANAVWLPSLSCSGWELRNSAGAGIGIVTAKHCGLLPSDGALATAPNGQREINLPYPVIAATGDSFSPGGMTIVGTVSEFYMDESDTDDVAIGAFQGQDPQAVLAAYNRQNLSAIQMYRLPFGSQQFTGGWPESQPDNPGVMSRQDFAERILGPRYTWTTNETGTTIENLDTLSAVTVVNEDGAMPSPGISGAVGLVKQPGGKIRLDGVASSASDFGSQAIASNPVEVAAVLKGLQATFYANLNKFSVVENLDDQVPSSATQAETLPVNVTGGLGFSPQAELAFFEFGDNFDKPHYQRGIINGLVYAPQYSNWIDRPVFMYDSASDLLVLGGYESGHDDIDDGLTIEVFNNASQTIGNLAVYSEDGSTPPGFTTSEGTLQAPNGGLYFTDANGFSFGRDTFPSEQPSTTQGDSLVVNNGQLNLVPPPGTEVPVASPNPNNP